ACVPIPLFFFLATRPPPRSTLFPYTTLFRSIRARHAAGDAALGRYFLDAIHPFVWRRSLDFGAIGEISAISRRIRDHYAQGQAFGPGFDLKRGRGGIREVEFFVQIHQLIHGGREPELRSASTVAALAALAGAGRLGAADAAALEE